MTFQQLPGFPAGPAGLRPEPFRGSLHGQRGRRSYERHLYQQHRQYRNV